MSYLVANPEDRFSRDEAHIVDANSNGRSAYVFSQSGKRLFCSLPSQLSYYNCRIQRLLGASKAELAGLSLDWTFHDEDRSLVTWFM